MYPLLYKTVLLYCSLCSIGVETLLFAHAGEVDPIIGDMLNATIHIEAHNKWVKKWISIVQFHFVGQSFPILAKCLEFFYRLAIIEPIAYHFHFMAGIVSFYCFNALRVFISFKVNDKYLLQLMCQCLKSSKSGYVSKIQFHCVETRSGIEHSCLII